MTSRRIIIRSKLVLFCLGAAFAFLSSCAEGEIYYRYHHLQNAKWYKDSTLVFKIDSLSFIPQRPYNVSVEVANNKSYPYQNLWLYVEHNFSDSLFHRDSLQLSVTDAYGRAKGKGVGRLYQLSIPYKTQVFRDSILDYEVRITQTMTDNPLIGIEKIGLKIQKKP